MKQNYRTKLGLGYEDAKKFNYLKNNSQFSCFLVCFKTLKIIPIEKKQIFYSMFKLISIYMILINNSPYVKKYAYLK